MSLLPLKELKEVIGPTLGVDAPCTSGACKTRHNQDISWNARSYPVDFEIRVGIDHMCMAYEPKVNKSGLPEMLLHYLSHLVEQASKDNPKRPNRILYYREGEEYSFSEGKHGDHFGDFISILSPGTYVFTHRERKLLVNIVSEGCAFTKEYLFVQLHWFREENPTSEETLGMEPLKTLLNDAKEFYPYDHQQQPEEGFLNVFRFTLNTSWEQLKRIPQRTLKSIHLPTTQKKRIVNRIQDFLDNKDKMTRLELPRRLAFLFSSPRGGGKTNLIHALLSHFKMHKGVLPIGELDSDLLCATSLPNQTAIVIENVHEIEDDVALMNLQTLLEGREFHRPLLIFLTCNNEIKLKEHIRKVLETCFRVDYLEDLKAPKKDEVKKMFQRFFPKQKQYFESFWQRLSQHEAVPCNLSLLEGFFAQHLDEDMNRLSDDEIHRFNAIIKRHIKNIEAGSSLHQ